MAQIRKYSPGGAFIKDGVSYNPVEGVLNELERLYPRAADAVRNGAKVYYDSNTNTITGVDYSDLSKGKQRRLQRVGYRDLEGKIMQQERSGISNLANFNYVGPTHDFSDQLIVEYVIDPDTKEYILTPSGNRQFVNGAINQAIMSRLDELANIEKYDTHDVFKPYVGNKAKPNLTKEDYIQFYKAHGANGIQSIKDKIKNGEWDASIAEALNDIGIEWKPILKKKEEKKERGKDGTIKQGEQDDDNNMHQGSSNWNAFLNIIDWDPVTGATIKDEQLAQLVSDAGGNVWLNNDFIRRYPMYAQYIPKDTGLFVIDGKVYRGDDLESLQKLITFHDFVNENKRTSGNSKKIKQYWIEGEESPYYNFSIDANGNQQWSPVFSDNTFGRDVTGDYVYTPGNPLIYDYFPNYNPDDPSQFDVYGFPLRSNLKRIYIDPITKQEKVMPEGYSPDIQTDPNAIRDYYDNIQYTAFNPTYTIGDTDGYRRINRTGDINNPNTGIALYYNPRNGRYYWYDENPGGEDFILNNILPSGQDHMRSYYWNIDPRLGKLLTKYPELIRDQNVRYAINSIIRNPYTSGSFFSERTALPSNLKQKIYKRGDGYDEFLQLLDALGRSQTLGILGKSYSGIGDKYLRMLTNPTQLAHYGLAYPVNNNQEQNVEYHQQGGAISRKSAIKPTMESIQQTDNKLREAGKEKEIGDLSKLTPSDMADIVSVVADGVSLGATFVPVYGNIAGAVSGTVGSGSTLYSDVKRDGLQFGDIGRFITNIGLDALTLVPGLGIGAKAGKLVKSIRSSKGIAKAIKYLGNITSMTGTYSLMQTSYDKIINGDDWTINDVRNIVNGLRSITNFRNLHSSPSKTKLSNTTTITTSNSTLPSSIKLNKSEIERISNLPKESQKDALKELLRTKLPDDVDTSSIDNLIDEYNIHPAHISSTSIRFPYKKGEGFRWPISRTKLDTYSPDNFEWDQVQNYRNPANKHWWQWNNRASIRDIKFNPYNPYHIKTPKIFRLPLMRNSNAYNAWLQSPMYHYSTNPVILGNIIPDFGISNYNYKEHPEYDIQNPPLFYKNGGQIIKGYQGIWFDPITGEIRGISSTENMKLKTPNKSSKLLRTRKENVGDIVINVSSPITTDSAETDKKVAAAQHNDEIKANQIKEESFASSKVSSADNNTNQNTDNPIIRSATGKTKSLNFNYMDPILRASDFLVSSLGIRKSNEEQRSANRDKGYGRLKRSVEKVIPIYNDNGIRRGIEAQKSELRNIKYTSSDDKLRRAEELVRDAKINEINDRGHMLESQNISNYNNQVLGLNAKYNELQTNIANANRETIGNMETAEHLINSQEAQQNAQNMKNAIYELRHDLAQDINEHKQAIRSSILLDAHTKIRREILSKYQSEWQKEPDKSKYGDDIEAYVRQKYPHQYEEIRAKYAVGVDAMLYNNRLYRNFPFSYVLPQIPVDDNGKYIQTDKRGGKIRKTDEQQYLDQQKAINKALLQLNSQIIKLFLAK